MKKNLVWIVCALLFLTSCAPNIGRDEVVQDDESEEETAVIPAYQLSEANYRIILPYKPSQARGIIVDQTPNRLDISEMDEGLMRQSMEVYDPEDYFFQEGQYLDSDTVYEWLGRQKTEDVIESELERSEERRVGKESRRGWTRH